MGAMDRDGMLAALTTAAAELTRPYTHTERCAIRQGKREITRPHRTRHPSLLDQLRQAVHAALGPGQHAHGITVWTEPADIGALDALVRIESGAAYWAQALGAGHQPSAEAAVHAVAHAALALDDRPLGYVTRQVERWHRTARLETRWDDPPVALRDPCPYCGERMLRVAADASAAWCTGCQTSWDSARVGVLAAMIGGGV